MNERPSPIASLPSLKLKLSALILTAVGLTVFIFWSGTHLGWWPSMSGIIAATFALGMTRWLARGVTYPLREMASAADALAAGDYHRRVKVHSRDEVGALANAFNRMAGELAAIDQLRRDLVANVSHELRTPIAALHARLENLIDGVEEPTPETLTPMLAQVERLGRLVSRLLDLSRLESGAITLERRPFALAPIVDQVITEQNMHTPSVHVRAEVDPGLLVNGDPERLHQVIANLVENAARHTETEVVVTATLDVEPQDHPDIVIAVVDDGPGIPAADAEHVFERFARTDAGRTRSQGGAGLGLAIAKWIVDLHGGTIAVRSHMPHGCRMEVRIPHIPERMAFATERNPQ